MNASDIILHCTTISVLFIVIVSTSTPQKSNTFGFWKTQFFLFSFSLYGVFALSDFKAYLIHKLPGQQYHTKFRKPGFRLQQSQYRIHQYNLRKFMSVIKETFFAWDRARKILSNCNCILYSYIHFRKLIRYGCKNYHFQITIRENLLIPEKD